MPLATQQRRSQKESQLEWIIVLFGTKRASFTDGAAIFLENLDYSMINQILMLACKRRLELMQLLKKSFKRVVENFILVYLPLKDKFILLAI